MTTVPAQEIKLAAADRDSILAEVGRLLTSGHLYGARNVECFEEEFARYVGTRYAVAVSSGTMALELIMLALNVADRTVIVPANTNFATFVAAARAGARVVLSDVDPDTLAPRTSDLQVAATPETAAVLLVHMGGMITPELPSIAAWCERHGIALVEDAAHAHGSTRDGRHAGTFGVAGAFSFFATKVMTTGEGGMVVTDSLDLASEIRLYRNLGKADAWVSHHVRMGTNGRMTEISAILGRHQLARLGEYVQARQRVADGYARALAGEASFRLLQPDHPYSGYKVPGELAAGIDREHLKRQLAAVGVQLAGEVYAEPLHRQPALTGQYAGQRFPGAERACARQICLPVYPTLGARRQDLVVSALAGYLSHGRRGDERG